jgi:hypothetical protein
MAHAIHVADRARRLRDGRHQGRAPGAFFQGDQLIMLMVLVPRVITSRWTAEYRLGHRSWLALAG